MDANESFFVAVREMRKFQTLMVLTEANTPERSAAIESCSFWQKRVDALIKDGYVAKEVRVKAVKGGGCY
jgi:hypothetical protein